MQKMTTSRTGLILSLLMTTFVACNLGSIGVNGLFSFSDQTPMVADLDHDLDRPLAVGNTLKIRVSGNSAIDTATSSDSSVLEVVEISGDDILVRGVSAGLATLEVKDTKEDTDQVELLVKDTSTTELHVLPWQSAVLPQDIYSGGMVLLPNTTVDIVALQQSDEGETLTGFSPQSWVKDGGLTSLVQKDESNFGTVRTTAELENFSLFYGENELEMEVVSEDAIVRVELVDLSHGTRAAAGERIVLDSDAVFHLLSLSAFDASGRYVVGAGSELMTIEQDNTDDILKVTTAQELTDPLSRSRTFIINSRAPGLASITISWLGHSETFEIEVKPSGD